MSFEVFLSHSLGSGDLPLLSDLQDRSDSLGIRLYFAERDPQLGTSVTAKVTTAISRADVVLALLTERGASSAWVNQEIGYAIGQGKIVVPLLEEGVEAPAMLIGREHVR